MHHNIILNLSTPFTKMSLQKTQW